MLEGGVSLPCEQWEPSNWALAGRSFHFPLPILPTPRRFINPMVSGSGVDDSVWKVCLRGTGRGTVSPRRALVQEPMGLRCRLISSLSLSPWSSVSPTQYERGFMKQQRESLIISKGTAIKCCWRISTMFGFISLQCGIRDLRDSA